jgi:hypothetical protein
MRWCRANNPAAGPGRPSYVGHHHVGVFPFHHVVEFAGVARLAHHEEAIVGDRWHVVLILELDDAGRIVTDTRYYAQPFDPPEWRAAWAESA